MSTSLHLRQRSRNDTGSYGHTHIWGLLSEDRDTIHTHKTKTQKINNGASVGESTEGHKNKMIPDSFCCCQHPGDASYWEKLAKTYEGKEPNLLDCIKKQADQQ